ncbi:glycosyltransferase family 2 protein [Nannocystis sp.]|uniref:glycosyltransferase family 2 protein n=1 Tax=Nannocystis sp. TaxID=1962667 RepID=UPI0025D3F672|nr:glycosyltransferase family 2 protein [Nannocystis sp.]
MAPPGRSAACTSSSARAGGDRSGGGTAGGFVEVGALAAVDDVLFTVVREIEHAYVVFDDAHAAATRTILSPGSSRSGIRTAGATGVGLQLDGGQRGPGPGSRGLGQDERPGQVGDGQARPRYRARDPVIIPVYNEGDPREQRASCRVGLDAAGLVRHEIVIAENGSRDRTREIAAELAAAHPRVRTFSCARPNYGAALREGIEGARGEYVLCEEIDLCDLDFHRRALELLRSGEAELVIGSKAMPGAHDRRPLLRRAADADLQRLLRSRSASTAPTRTGSRRFAGPRCCRWSGVASSVTTCSPRSW